MDIEQFTSMKTEKILHCYSVKGELLKADVMSLRHMKRVRLNNDLQMLAVPRYSAKSKDILPVDYLCFLYKNEERVLSDIIYAFKDSREFPAAI